MQRLSILVCLLGLSVAIAQADGTTSANFMQLPISPRAAAMGGAQVGLADDAYAAEWNPAGLAQLAVPEAALVQHQYVENITQQFLTYAHPRPFGSFAGQLNYLSTGKIRGYDAADNVGNTVSASDALLGLSFARSIWGNRRNGSLLAVGLTGKYLQENLASVRARAFASDIGLLFRPDHSWGKAWQPWRAGLVLRNLGTPIRFDRQSFELPSALAAGISYSGAWRDEGITVAIDGNRLKADPFSCGVGLEVRTLQFLLLRLGYSSVADLGDGLRFGGGIRFKTLQVDYAHAAGGEFGAIHRIGVSFRFGKPAEDPQYLAQRLYEKGVTNYQRRRFTEALVDLNKALELDPQHPDALRMMKKTYDEIKTLVPE
jgi:hypothetical protein